MTEWLVKSNKIGRNANFNYFNRWYACHSISFHRFIWMQLRASGTLNWMGSVARSTIHSPMNNEPIAVHCKRLFISYYALFIQAQVSLSPSRLSDALQNYTNNADGACIITWLADQYCKVNWFELIRNAFDPNNVPHSMWRIFLWWACIRQLIEVLCEHFRVPAPDTPQ